MRLQLALAGVWLAAASARADDRAEVSTSLFAEQREDGKGGLTVVHPQADVGVDLGRFTTLEVSYAADAVSGATSVIYQADAIVRRSHAARFAASHAPVLASKPGADASTP